MLCTLQVDECVGDDRGSVENKDVSSLAEVLKIFPKDSECNSSMSLSNSIINTEKKESLKQKTSI